MNMGLCRIGNGTLVGSAVAVYLIVASLHCQSLGADLVVADLVDEVNVVSYMDYLENDLYAYDGDDRAYGPEHDLARQRIQERFEGFGLTTSLDPFVYSGTEYYNVVGVHPGVICPNEIYIVGAHYDTVAGSPGAWDNASGVAAVLEAARVLSQYAFEGTIIFIAFDREEQGLIGSSAYASAHAQDHIRGMISADSFAYRPYQPEDPNYSKVTLCYDNTRSTKLLYDLEGALGSYAGLTCVIVYFPPAFMSDNTAFETIGFAAAWLRSYGWSPFLHTSSDSVDRPGYINYDYGTQITRAMVGYLADSARLAYVRVLPDFDGDGLVNLEDFALLAQHWGQSESQFDVSPPPNGDGIVGVEDLVGLAYYWLNRWSIWWEESGRIAWWGFDEVEGSIAHDSPDYRPATLHGDPLWQPTGGKINGALELDGVDDYVSTPFVLNPAGGPFSVFAWVKAGAPGQVVISQTGGANWLSASPAEGKLMTEMMAAGRFGRALISGVVITDGAWHRVGLTWDGSKNRILYADDVEVAKDMQGALAGSDGSLQIGAGKGLEAGSFWSGLIDDVRIYNRAVKP